MLCIFTVTPTHTHSHSWVLVEQPGKRDVLHQQVENIRKPRWAGAQDLGRDTEAGPGDWVTEEGPRGSLSPAK